MAQNNIGLVYGGGSIGLMGETARAVLAAGGHVTGIIPDFLVSKERMQEGVQELIVTTNMHERKMAMFERSSGFVALPGGILHIDLDGGGKSLYMTGPAEFVFEGTIDP